MKEYLLKHKISVILISISLVIYLVLSFTTDSTDATMKENPKKTSNIIDNSKDDTSTYTNNTYSNDKSENINKNIDNFSNNINDSSDGYLVNKDDLKKMKDYKLYTQYKKSPFSVNVIDNDNYINALIYPNEGSTDETEKTSETEKNKDTSDKDTTKTKNESSNTNTQKTTKEAN